MMTRRHVLLSLAAAARPVNVLLLLADNWAAPHAGAYGHRAVRTPVFDRIARDGALFTHAFAPNPSCSPSRASLLSGQETHRLGEAASLYGPIDAAVPLYTDRLADAGYQVAFRGKGFGPGEARRAPGRAPNPAGRLVESFGALSNTTPFCYWFGSHDPHVPWNRGRDTSIDEAALPVPPHLPDAPAVRRDLAGYYREVQQFDRECGEILAEVERRGQLDSTLVIMTSDNGWQMPRGLANCYDLGVRIPLAVRFPARIRAGTVRTDFVSIAALAPTILEACGLPAIGTTPSLFSRTRREEIFLERERHANVRRGDLSYPVRGLRTRDFLYLRNLEPARWPAGDPEMYWAVGPYGDVDNSFSKLLLLEQRTEPFFSLAFGKRPAEELYDVRQDPGQVHNLAGRQQHAGTLQRMAARVDRWMRDTADPRAAEPHSTFWDRAPYSGRRGAQAPPE